MVEMGKLQVDFYDAVGLIETPRETLDRVCRWGGDSCSYMHTIDIATIYAMATAKACVYSLSPSSTPTSSIPFPVAFASL